MGSCREILTLQLGTYANYVGTHWWNLQESGFNYSPGEKSELCHDVLYREGINFKGEITFTPRAIFVENQARVPPIPMLDAPGAGGEGDVLWDPSLVERVPQESPALHPFHQDLDAGADTSAKDYSFEDSARLWSDLLRTRLHARSVVTGYEKFDDDLEDRIRGYVEECDNVQGFHLLLSPDPQFFEILTFLEDEYSSKTRLSFPLLPAFKGDRTWPIAAERIIQNFLTNHHSAGSSTLTVPLSVVQDFSLTSETVRAFPDLFYSSESDYHSSAILACYLEAMSTAYRLAEDRRSIWGVISGFTMHGWKFGAASISLPFAKVPGLTLQKYLEERSDDVPLWTSLTPTATLDDAWYYSGTLRGLPDGEVLGPYLQYLYSTTSILRSVTAPLRIVTPFPKLFSSHVSSKGSVDLTASRAAGFEVVSCPALAGLHACPGLGDMLQTNLTMAKKIDIRRLTSVPIEADLMEEAIEAMTVHAKNHSSLMDTDII